MIVMGLHAFGHDTGAAILTPNLCTAITEERLTREKYDQSLPLRSIHYCLDAAGVRLEDVALFVYDRDFGRFPQNRIEAFFRKSFGWFDSARFVAADHHVLHAWGAVAMARPVDAAILVVDGNGSLIQESRMYPKVANSHPSFCAISETVKVSLFRFNDGRLVRIRSLTAPPGIGALYTTFTQYLGFGKLDAGKTMGLAAYSQGTDYFPPCPVFTPLHEDCYDLAFEYHPNMHDVDILEILLNHERRTPSAPLPDPFYNEVAGLIQRACEDWLLHTAKYLSEITKCHSLLASGGVMLNCKANQLLEESGLFDQCFFFPAASDTGIPIGASYFGWDSLIKETEPAKFDSIYTGRPYTTCEINQACAAYANDLEVEDACDVSRRAAEMLADGYIVALFQGGAELGPRALGNRSILADARNISFRDTLNVRVKKREQWRPFAPVVLAEMYSTYFEGRAESRRFMNVASTVKPEMRSIIPGVVHVDGTARPQIVMQDSNLLLYRILSAYYEQTGVAVLINTSYNIAGKPIVESPNDALECLIYTGLDAVAFPDRIVRKKARSDPKLG